jgi:cytochrome c oxidase assembly protein subunit 15
MPVQDSRAQSTSRGWAGATCEKPIGDSRLCLPTLAPMRAPRLSPAVFRRLTLVNVVLLVAIIVSGAAVRLTNSGLGCADWPNCSATKLVDVSGHHAAIEQLNRIFSGAIGIPIGLALVGSYLREPRRRDLVRQAWLLFALFWAEAVLGGISVMVKLAWVSVMGHFLLAITLVGIALLMHQRAGEPEGDRRPVVPLHVEWLARAVYAMTIWVLVLGTLVTAAGPHGGDEEARRLGWPLGDVARVHGVSVDILVVLVVVLVVALVRVRAPRRVLTVASLTLLAMTAQGILGYVQYAEHIPAVLVGFHVFGAVIVFVCVQQLLLDLRVPASATVTLAEPLPAAAPVTVGR